MMLSPYLRYRPLWAATLLLAWGLSGCSGTKEKESSEAAAAAAPAPRTMAQAQQVVSVGRVEPEQKIYPLAAEVSGIVRAVGFQSGDALRSGDVILELVRDLEEAAVAQAQATVQTKRQELQTQEATIEAQRLTAANAREKANRLKTLVEKGFEVQQTYDNAETEAQSSAAQLRSLTAKLEAQKLDVFDAELRLRTARIQLEKRYVRAPSAGHLLTMDITPGAPVKANEKYAEFAPEGYLSVLTEVDELFANQVKLGAEAQVRLLGLSEILATGKVIYTSNFLKKKSLFSEQSTEKEDRRVREVRIRLEQPGPLLIGNRVECILPLTPATAAR